MLSISKPSGFKIRSNSLKKAAGSIAICSMTSRQYIKSYELSKMSKLISTRTIYKILSDELNTHIHSIQIELI